MRRLSAVLASAVVLLGARAASAQGGTDIWVASIEVNGAQLRVGPPRNLTQRPGYDNQPSFTPDGSAILYTRIENGGPPDIYLVPVGGGAPSPMTRTVVESEYSATPMPDGRGFSVIRVEADSTQRMWAFDWDGTPRRILVPALKPVGYHVWIGEAFIGAFVLGEPNALVLADPRTERVDTLARGIGRAFARIPGRDAFTFIHLHGDTSVIGEVDVRTATVRRVALALAGGEYHVWHPSGVLIASSGSKLWQWRNGQWETLAEFAQLGVRGITRLALSADGTRIAFVAAEGAPR